MGYYNRYGKAKMGDGGQTVQHEIGSGLMISGNDRISDAPTLMRMIFIRVDRKELGEEFHGLSRKMANMREKGYSALGLRLFFLRGEFDADYADLYEKAKSAIAKRAKDSGGNTISRLIETASVLYATYSIASRHIALPFTEEEVVKRLLEVMDDTLRELRVLEQSDFWEIVNILMNRTSEERSSRLVKNWDYKFVKNKAGEYLLELPLTFVYDKYAVEVQKRRGEPKSMAELRKWLECQPYFDSIRNSSTFTYTEYSEGQPSLRERSPKTWRFRAVDLSRLAGLNFVLGNEQADEGMRQAMLAHADKEADSPTDSEPPAVNELSGDIPF